MELAELGDDEQATAPAPKWAESHCKILLLNPFRVLPFFPFSTASFTGGYSYFVLSGLLSCLEQRVRLLSLIKINRDVYNKSKKENIIVTTSYFRIKRVHREKRWNNHFRGIPRKIKANKTAAGILSTFRNKDKMNMEKEAWKIIAQEKHGNNWCQNITTSEKTVLIEALKIYHIENIDFVDAILVAYNHKKGATIHSFDKKVNKLCL